MVSLSDHQLRCVMQAAVSLEVEKRDLFLQRVAAMLKMRGRFTDADVSDVAQLGVSGLVHHHAA